LRAAQEQLSSCYIRLSWHTSDSTEDQIVGFYVQTTSVSYPRTSWKLTLSQARGTTLRLGGEGGPRECGAVSATTFHNHLCGAVSATTVHNSLWCIR